MRLEAGGVDMALLDLSLPDSQGLDTLVLVYACVPHVPIVVLMGLDNTVLAAQAVWQGAQDYLVKGRIDGDLLRRTIRYAIERQQMRVALQVSERQVQNLILHHADGIIVVVDQQELVRFANPAAEALLSRPGDQLIGIPFGFPVVVSNSTQLKLDRPDGKGRDSRNAG
ncbi:hypothetical protein NKDENANG_02224 [Candidatus Entotheonellaceae bacterium PAL068K]